MTISAGNPILSADVLALAVTISYSENALAANVDLTNANQFYDGPSLTLSAGTYLLIGNIIAKDTTQVASFTAQLWDGTNVFCSGQVTSAGAQYVGQVFVSAVVVPAGSTTYKISVASNAATNGKIYAACPANGVGNNASRLTALKIA